MELWRPGPEWHQRISADVLRSYLRRRGWSQRDLARALGVSEVHVSHIFNPEPRPRVARLIAPRREGQLFDLLEIDPEGREVLRDHLARARRGRRQPEPEGSWLDRPAVEAALASLRDLHGVASYSPDAAAAGRAYLRLWEAAGQILERVHPRQQALDRFEVLMLLHDAACVLNRPALALGYARQALVLLDQDPPTAAAGERFDQARVHAHRAEIVALNNLGLPGSALDVAERVEQELPGFAAATALWLPQLAGDQLSSYGRLPGHQIVIGDAEGFRHAAERYVEPRSTMAAMLDNGLARAYLTHGSTRSLRRAEALIETGRGRAEDGALPLGPLHRALLLRTAARYELCTRGSTEIWAELLGRCLTFVDEVGLTHQRAELEQEFGPEVIGELARTSHG